METSLPTPTTARVELLIYQRVGVDFAANPMSFAASMRLLARICRSSADWIGEHNLETELLATSHTVRTMVEYLPSDNQTLQGKSPVITRNIYKKQL